MISFQTPVDLTRKLIGKTNLCNSDVYTISSYYETDISSNIILTFDLDKVV